MKDVQNMTKLNKFDRVIDYQYFDPSKMTLKDDEILYGEQNVLAKVALKHVFPISYGKIIPPCSPRQYL